MKAMYSATAIALLLMVCSHADAQQTLVRGYTKKDGTYVAPHYRSAPNSSRLDNYSTRGNYNPYTGKKGTVDPYALPRYSSPSYSSTPTYSAPPRVRYVPPPVSNTDRWWATPSEAETTSLSASANPAGEDEVRSDLIALSVRLKQTDPFYDIRFPILLKQIQQIKGRYPLEQIVEQVERLYWAIPATKASPYNAMASLGSPISLAGSYGRPICRRLEEARDALEDAAQSLLDCTQSRDYSNDCNIEVMEVTDVGDEYADAVSEADGICE
jgi:hypothetical protein